MTDIFQEVEEDLRRERLKKVWDRFGIYVILAAVLIVAITAGWRGYEAWRTDRERTAGDTFLAVLSAAESADGAAAATPLVEFAEDAPQGYAMLARFRAASAYAGAGEHEEAATLLRALAADSSVASLYQDIALVRLSQVLIDAGDPTGAIAAAAPLAEDTANPFSPAAQEMMAVAAYANGDIPTAQRWFEQLAEGANIAPDLQQRAGLMLDLIRQTTGAPAEDAAADASGEETN